MPRAPAVAPARREDLLRVARDVFVERGFAATGMRDIAARMGIGAASLYHYIDSKQDLLLEVMLDVQTPTASALQRGFRAPGEAPDKLIALARAHVRNIASDQVGSTLLFTEVDALTAGQRPAVVAGWNRYRGALEQLVREGQAAGTIRRDVHHGLIAMCILGMLNWTYRWYRREDEWPAEDVGGALGEMVVRGLLASSHSIDPATVPRVTWAPDAGELRQGREREIFTAATALFNERGFASTTMRDIASAVDLHTSTLYHYVHGKQALLYAIVREAQEAAIFTIERLLSLEAEPAACLQAILTCHAEYLARNIARARLAFKEARSMTAENLHLLRSFDAELTAGLRRLIVRGQASGAFAPAFADALVVSGLMGALNWLFTWYRPDGLWQPPFVACALTDILLHGLAPRP